MEEYEKLSKKDDINPDVWVNLACSYFFLGMYPQADDAAKKCTAGNNGDFNSVDFSKIL